MNVSNLNMEKWRNLVKEKLIVCRSCPHIAVIRLCKYVQYIYVVTSKLKLVCLYNPNQNLFVQ